MWPPHPKIGSPLWPQFHAPAIKRRILMTREYINPPGVPKRTHYTRVLTIDKPSKLVYIAGQTPADDKYQPVHAGDVRAQYVMLRRRIGRPTTVAVERRQRSSNSCPERDCDLVLLSPERLDHLSDGHLDFHGRLRISVAGRRSPRL